MNTFFSVAILLAGAAPVPKESPPPPAQFPLTVGTEWVYETGRAVTRLKITYVEFRDDAHFVSIGRIQSDKNVKPDRVIKVAKDGLFEVEYDGIQLIKPACLLKLPIKQGDSWKALASKFTVGETEEVTVPAGKFRATRVVSESTVSTRAGELTTTEIEWYAPGIGVVKKQFGDKVIVERSLKSFTLGKESPEK